MEGRIPQRLSVFGALLALVAVSACTVGLSSEAYTAREEKRFTVDGVAELELATFGGSIQVRGSDRSDIVVEIEKTGSSQAIVDSIKVVAKQDGHRVRVEARGPDTSEWMIGVGSISRSARLVAIVPRNCNVMADSRDGSIKFERLTGRFELRSGDGSVQGYDLEGGLIVETEDGSVKLQSVTGKVDARTGDGALTVEGRLTAARLRTEDGSIRLRIERGSAMDGDWEVRTGDGSVSLQFPDDFAAEIDASTADGSVRADAELALHAGRGASRRRIEGTLGSGGHRLTVSSGDGSVVLRRY